MRISPSLNENNGSLHNTHARARHTQSLAAREFLNTLIMRNRAAGNRRNFYNSGDESFCLPEGETSSACALSPLVFKSADAGRVSPQRTCDDGSDSGSRISPGPPPASSRSKCCAVLSLLPLQQEMPFPLVWPGKGERPNDWHYRVYRQPPLSRSER